ncbi:GDCCVxC domain-containing (seleno)protein [Pseudomonas aeruginosa]|uniref:GDCCVxC domain-containing (seleno)protein n=1 Tax=Pseudomonas aeruginosa TaxID=287 RepID=UPI003B43BA0B
MLVFRPPPRRTQTVAEVKLQSTLACPACGHRTTEIMPTMACQFFYECTACHTLLRPKEGDCCVFCSYGTVPCPPIQQHSPCCGSTS